MAQENRGPKNTPAVDGLSTAAKATLFAAAAAVTLAMVPCFGWLNWIVSPACLIPMVLGGIGMGRMSSFDGEPGAHPGPFLAALIGGALLFVASGGRLVLGAGLM
jgi:hypothetical protein